MSGQISAGHRRVAGWKTSVISRLKGTPPPPTSRWRSRPTRKPYGTGAARRARSTDDADPVQDRRVPHPRQVQGQPRRPAADRDRHGRHPRRHPRPGLVLARQHVRLAADPAGQDRHAGLGARQGHLGRRPRVLLGPEPPVPAAGRRRVTSSGRSCGGENRWSRRRCPGKAATSRSPGTCRSRKSGSPTPPTGSCICYNPDAAERDAAIRAGLMSKLGKIIAGTEQADRHRTGRAAREDLHDAGPEPVPARHPRRAAPQPTRPRPRRKRTWTASTCCAAPTRSCPPRTSPSATSSSSKSSAAGGT